MNRVKTSFPIFVLLLSLVACTQAPIASAATPTFTPYVGGTQTALAGPTPWMEGTETALAAQLASPTPWVEGTQTALALPSSPTPGDTPAVLPTFSFPTTTPPPPSVPNGTFSPVFYVPKDVPSVLLVGGIQQDRGWLSAQDAATYVKSDIGYDFYGPHGSFRVPGSPIQFSPTCRNYFMQAPVSLPEAMVGVGGDWVSTPPGVTELSVDDPAYMQAVADWFQSQGDSPAEIHINRILQTDLEGDGINEVLLGASYFKDSSGHMAQTGDYSTVLMRKVVGNNVITVPLINDYYVTSTTGGELSYPNTYALVGFLDLNRDGTLEVIVGVSRWEGFGALVYRVDGQNVREVMRAIC